MLSGAIEQAFSYDLPAERIAQRPVHPYDAARLLVVDRSNGALQDAVFSDLTGFLRAGDLMVFNDTRVIPARFFGRLEESGAGAEVLLVKEEAEYRWRCLGKPLKKFRAGLTILFEEGLGARIVERLSEQEVLLDFFCEQGGDTGAAMRRLGLMPIPPYIRRGRSDAADREDYQTFFALEDGSIAAPTASLHFTPELVTRIKDDGVEIAYLTLHVGTASFLPLWDEDGSERMKLRPPAVERYECSAALRERAEAAKREGRRVIAVGTTVVRALESMRPGLGQGAGETDLFIRPGHELRTVDAVITNFHQPRTTHLLLVQALMGRELLERAYGHAMAGGYRFLSYGDGMFII